MYYGDIKQFDVANGPGVRVSLFVSGCHFRCKGCFNAATWDFNYGKPFTDETIDQIIEYLKPEYIKGFTILGGEPWEKQNQLALLPLLRRVRATYPDINIWCFTGYQFDRDLNGWMVKHWPETREMLSYIDVIVDGMFVEALKDLSLRFKGSSNQRTILVQESLQAGKVILWDDSEPKY
ncbi:MAG: anaerobic ribonucleoside-triphosphate reductase activating protein [Lachnospiraceae bacterium]|nr:anaerobic ribonucleoside-triphosphate reductase activating protein [Lachnospiraceae bacterium]